MTLPKQIAVVGAGYVGLTTACCLAHLGHNVRCSDADRQRVAGLARGIAPIVESGLREMLVSGLSSGRLLFGSDNAWAVGEAEFAFICVPTPEGVDGRADTSIIEAVARQIGPSLASNAVVVNKSTVPVGATQLVSRALGRSDVSVVSNPEFLREGSAVHDFLHPDRVVIGAPDEETAVRLAALFVNLGAPLVLTDNATAETIKYAANGFLATKVSFVNALAALCEAVGADTRKVVEALAFDPRIGRAYLNPGPGWGGPCFPKDATALAHLADDAGYDFSLLKGVIAVNNQQYQRVVDKAARAVGGCVAGKRIGLWGASFKAGTDDLRCSPALEVGARLLSLGAEVAIYDPTLHHDLDGYLVVADPYAAAQGAEVVVLATEWDEFRWLDFEKVGALMERRSIVDARNLLDSNVLRDAGFAYEGIGIA